jgi:protein-tyrosine phosphatase/membrane-associated phospholipid phosphatase
MHRAAAPSEDVPTKMQAALRSAGLSFLFIVLYGACNWITTQRANVGTWYYGFERHIPFVPLMIVPYMSIDLFFVGAPFLCRTQAELRTLSRRISFGILVASICFLLIPLRLAVPNPQTAGWTGELFRFLHGFDQPYNLFPSLHVTLWAILANAYARHTRGLLRAACHVWFSLICISTLLTYQHHLVDVLGGFVLAMACFHLFREQSGKLGRGTPNYRLGCYYLLGAVVFAGLAWFAWPWTGALFWPAISLASTASGYFGLGPGIYRKYAGRIPLSARVLLAPSLAGQFLSLIYYRRQCCPWNQVTPRVWIGVRLSSREAVEAKRQGVTAVLDLTAEFSESGEFLKLTYLNIPVLDLARVSLESLNRAVSFIASNAENGVVYVHCKAGYSRSAVAIGAYLLATGQAETIEEALAIQRQARPTIVFRPEVYAALQTFHSSRKSSIPASASSG